MAEAIKYGFYAVNSDYLEYLNQIDSEVYYNPSYRNSISKKFQPIAVRQTSNFSHSTSPSHILRMAS